MSYLTKCHIEQIFKKDTLINLTNRNGHVTKVSRQNDQNSNQNGHFNQVGRAWKVVNSCNDGNGNLGSNFIFYFKFDFGFKTT